MFQNVDAYAGDPILSLMETFKQDPRDHKVNLSIGLYYNEAGIIPQLQAVAAAEERLQAQPHGVDLGSLKSQFPALNFHADKKIHCLPSQIPTEIQRLPTSTTTSRFSTRA